MQNKAEHEYKTKTFLHSGYCSNAYILDEKFILLEGRYKDSFGSYEDIKKRIDVLKNQIKSVEIPSELKLIKPNENLKFGGLIYKMVKGKMFDPKTCANKELNNIAKKLAEFINEVHSSVVEFKDGKDFINGIYSPETIYNKEEQIENVTNKIIRNISLLEKYLTKDEIVEIKKWAEKFTEFAESREFVITHGDLWSENLILDENNKLKGVIDFEMFEYFVPESDYDLLSIIGEDFLETVIKHSVIEIKKENVELCRQYREIYSFENMVRESEEEIQEALGKIRKVFFNNTCQADVIENSK